MLCRTPFFLRHDSNVTYARRVFGYAAMGELGVGRLGANATPPEAGGVSSMGPDRTRKVARRRLPSMSVDATKRHKKHSFERKSGFSEGRPC